MEETTFVSQFDTVLEVIPKQDLPFVRADARRHMNATNIRPSDAARSAVADYRSMGREQYLKRWHEVRKSDHS